MEYLVDFEKRAWESPMKGLRFKALSHGSTRLRLVEYSDDMEPHWCENGHVGLILEGSFEIEFPGRTIVFGSGDGVFIPKGAEHHHRARVLSGPVRALFVEEV
jgi:ethanolamine utilization protein EutQ (cupin superfamily)